MPLPVPPAHVVSVRIVHYPDRVLTRTALGAADLERLATTHTLVKTRSDIDGVVEALDAMPSSPAQATPDSRWGVTLIGPGGTILAHVYLDKFGKRALIDGKAAHVEGEKLVHLLAQLVPAS